MADVRLIDANALLDFISDERKEAADNKNHEKMRGNDYEMHFWSGALVQARWIRQYVNEAPTIDAAPVVHARWVPNHGSYGTPHCSNCKWRIPYSEDSTLDARSFCPNCGAKMDATDNNVGHKDDKED